MTASPSDDHLLGFSGGKFKGLDFSRSGPCQKNDNRIMEQKSYAGRWGWTA
ncbi:MAG TPA: hypothetical protein VHS28_05975 [Chloroflexota bacterium]|nr:hypothetical protein [Chloroflexota bacterium]